MRIQFGTLIAVVGSTLTALSLTGSTQISANHHKHPDPSTLQFLQRENSRGAKEFASGNYQNARQIFLATASLADKAGAVEMAATAYNNAGGAALARFDYRSALNDLVQAAGKARVTGGCVRYAAVANNLASLYLRLANNESAIEISRDALAHCPTGTATPRLETQLARALGASGSFAEAQPLFLRAIRGLEEQGDLEAAAATLSSLGREALDAGQLGDADAALTEAFRLVKTHKLNTAANVFRILARLKDKQGDAIAAATLFDSAVNAPHDLAARWLLYLNRGEFRAAHGNLHAALEDFRTASRLTALLRTDMVRADQSRVGVDFDVSRVAAGLVNAGNRLALEEANGTLLEETFDAAETGRLWSLQSLIPTASDWRTRLPETYWDLLAQYQKSELSLLAQPSESARSRTSALSRRLQEIEAAAGDERPGSLPGQGSPLNQIRQSLDQDTVFISFHLSSKGSWIWAADRTRVRVWSLPPREDIAAAVTGFTKAVQSGSSDATTRGLGVYRLLFANVDLSFLKHSHWLLELDGPLFDLPFAALAVTDGANGPVYLAERAAIQIIPSALLLQRRKAAAAGQLLAVGDAIYNRADERFEGKAASTPSLTLARLPATAREMKACAIAWGESRSKVLSGNGASAAHVNAALRNQPTIIHFATHVIAGPGEFSSGLIALSLDRSGTLGLLGPREIVARPVNAELVVLNGCHSAQGQTLPGAGLMGLTRAWIGAGAAAVLATRWDIADGAGEEFIVDFYRELGNHWDEGPSRALQRAQINLLKERKQSGKIALLAAYFLLGRA